MGKYLEKFKQGAAKVDKKIMEMSREDKRNEKSDYGTGMRDEFDDSGEFRDDFNDNWKDYDKDFDRFDEMDFEQGQKPESFHHFILQNKYEDLEMSIRGFKKIFDKDKQRYVIKRKERHCFTDEEAEGIVGAAKTHLSTDIKLAKMSLEAFGKMMDLIFEQFESYFYRIAEYRYGRYNTFNKNGVLVKINYDLQGKMKDENKKILIELYNSIWANYSRAIGGMENKYTHDSVKGQESLQQTDNDFRLRKRYT